MFLLRKSSSPASISLHSLSQHTLRPKTPRPPPLSPLPLSPPPPPGLADSRQLATNFGDTLASELGILSPSPPRYVLTGQPVPPGTNGGVSLYGLVMSAVGGTAISVVMVLTMLFEKSCAGTRWATEMILFGTAAGFLGSLVSFFRLSLPPSCYARL